MLPDGDGHEPDADRRADVHDRLHPRHLGPQGLHRGARAPDAARRPHRPPEPRAVRRPHGPRDRGRRARRRAARRPAGRPRRVPHDQRDARAARTATRCSRRSPSGSDGACATPTRWRAWAATSSGSSPSDETDVETAEAIAWKVRAAFEEPFLIAGEVVNVRASIGIAFFPQHGRTTADLLRRAYAGDAPGQAGRRRRRRLRRRAGGPDRAPARRC